MKEEKSVFTREQTRLLLNELSKFRYFSYRSKVRAKVKKPAGYRAALRIIRAYETTTNRVMAKAKLEHDKIYEQAHKAIIFGDSRKKIEALLDKLRKMSK